VRPGLLAAALAALLAAAACASGEPAATAPPAPTDAGHGAASRTPTAATSILAPPGRAVAAPAPAGRVRPRPAASAPPRLLPDRMADTRGAAQLVAVTNGGAGATGTLEAFERVDGRWRRAFGPIPAKIGAQGFSRHVSERTTATPIGLFTLTEAFGTEPDPGAALPYRRTRYGDVWVDEPASPHYNTLQPGDADAHLGSGERLWELTAAYPYAIVIDYNRRPVVPGAGSAFFLHATISAPSQGCVTVDRALVRALLRWLRPAAHPRIALGPLAAVLQL
jgi:L,D-peptidoglycan transpeptidase YkuD (ErfK/YbiS/YcfS/YnhG family)